MASSDSAAPECAWHELSLVDALFILDFIPVHPVLERSGMSMRRTLSSCVVT